MAKPIIELTRGVPTTDKGWLDVFGRINKFLKVVGDQLQIGGSVQLPELSIGTDELKADAVTNDKLRDSAALSVVGRPSDTGGNPSDIISTVSDTLMVRRGSALTWDVLEDGDIPASIARDSEVAAAIAAHVAASDPHTGYLTPTEGNAAYVQLANVLNGSATYDPPNLADGAEASTTVTATGAALGDFALASFSLSTQGIKLTAEVTAADTVTVNFHNHTGGAIDLASGTLRVRVWKQ